MRNGVVLVLVLLLLALSAAIVSQICFRVTSLTNQAILAEKELRHRWSMTTLRKSYLAAAPRFFADVNREANFVSTLSGRIILNRTAYELVLRDESAKLPVNRLFETENRERVLAGMDDVIEGNLHLRSDAPLRVSRWSDVFDLERSKDARMRWSQLQLSTDNLTLWSEGQVNVTRCSDQVLLSLWKSLFRISIPESFQRDRNKLDRAGVRESVARSGLSERDAERALSWVSAESNAFSLWISPGDASDLGPTAIYVWQRFDGYADNHFGYFDP